MSQAESASSRGSHPNSNKINIEINNNINNNSNSNNNNNNNNNNNISNISNSSNNSNPHPPRSATLRQEHILTPITAVAFCKLSDGRLLLLVGEDGWLKVFDPEKQQQQQQQRRKNNKSLAPCAQLKLFAKQLIHGIYVSYRPHDDSRSSPDETDETITTGRPPPPQLRLLVWGARSVTVLPLSSPECLLQLGNDSSDEAAHAHARAPGEWRAPDWIYDGLLSPYERGYDAGLGVLLTAHNELVRFSVGEEDEDEDRDEDDTSGSGSGPVIRLLGQPVSPSRPILYSGALRWTAPGCVLVAAGTVYGEIIVWRCYLPDGDDDDDDGRGTRRRRRRQQGAVAASCEVLFVLTGHEGSILGVDIAPEMEMELVSSATAKVRFLASCSDDRTIRVWDITERGSADESADRDADRQKSYLDSWLEARETGFGGGARTADVEEGKDNEDAGANSSSSSRCVAVAMGHLSRIWHVKFAGPPRHDRIALFSFGEDATRQRWELELQVAPPQLQGTLGHAGTLSCHSGKNIWAAACFDGDSGGGEPLVATGGADGKVALMGYSRPVVPSHYRHGHDHQKEQLLLNGDAAAAAATLEEEQEYDKNMSVALSLDNIPLPSPPRTTPLGKKDSFLCYTFLSERRLVVHTSFGRLFLVSVGHGSDDLHWEEVALPDDVRIDLKSYVITRSPQCGVEIIGTESGQLYLFEETRGVLYPLTKFPGKIANILCLPSSSSFSHSHSHSAARQNGNTTFPSSSSSASQGAITILVTVVSKTSHNHATLLTLDRLSGDDDDDNDNKLVIVDTKRIKLFQSFMVTGLAACGTHLILGSRIGWIAVYGAATGGGDLLVEKVSRRDGQAKDAITSIVALPGSATSFVAGGRDGKYRVYEIVDVVQQGGEKTVTLSLLHEVAPPLAFIEGIWFTRTREEDDRDEEDEEEEKDAVEMIMYGFRSKHFVVWNETTQQELARVECGGHHRSFDVAADPRDPGRVSVVFSEAAQMHLYAQRQLPHRTVKPGGHGREIRAVASCGAYVATAAEDTVVRVWAYDDSNNNNSSSKHRGGGGGFRCLAVLEKHTTGIQCLKWLGTDTLLSSAGNEEFFIWRVSRLGRPGSDYDALGIVCEAVCPPITPDGDLRVTSFDAEQRRSAIDGDSATIFISLALSNSTLMSYRYTAESGKFTLLCQGRYTGACLTQIRHLEVVPGRPISLLTASTDGRVALWRSISIAGWGTPHDVDAGEFRLQATTKIHQSSIKCLALAVMRQERIMGMRDLRRVRVITGGDDNALGVLDVEWCAEKKAWMFTAGSKHRMADAHAAAVTGICVARQDQDADVVELATVSNDQRAKLWRLSSSSSSSSSSGTAGDGVRVKISLLENRYSAVADPGDVELIFPGKLMVGGVGMEVWSWA